LPIAINVANWQQSSDKFGLKKENGKLNKTSLFGREKREITERETRGKSRDKAETKQRKNKETRRICSLIISRRIRQVRHLKRAESEESET
jgi:hypothetical protein